MSKGEYEFPILVTCLLILALQIHNPFQTPRLSSCRCDGTQPAGSSSVARPPDTPQYSSPPVHPGVQQQQPQPPPGEPPASPVYRRPQATPAGVATPGGGLSTDALLRELDSIQVKAKEQQDTLAAAGKMPPPSPLLQHLRETEAAEEPPVAAARSGGGGFGSSGMAPQAQTQMMPAPGMGGPGGVGVPGGAVADGTPMLRRRDDFGRFLEARQPRGLGVVLGVGRGDFALRLLSDWGSSQGVFLVDPFIHIWRGYNDPDNLSDRDHQMVFEDLRNRLAPFEGRHVLVRDFSHSFAESYMRGGTAPGLATFVYIDANHAEAAVTRDLELWWPLVASGGVLAGSTYADDGGEGRVRVRSAVDKFVSQQRLQLYLTHDDRPPSWFVFKP